MNSVEQKAVPVSLVVIVKNSASSLRRCLESASFVDEILVVDSGSTDDTVEVARECGARVLFLTGSASQCSGSFRASLLTKHIALPDAICF